MSEWLKEMGCKPIGYAYAGSNPAPPTGVSRRPAGGGENFSTSRPYVRMSEQPQAQHADRRAPFRKATPTRQSAAGPGDRIANATAVAGYFREDCRPLSDSLQLEMVVAQ